MAMILALVICISPFSAYAEEMPEDVPVQETEEVMPDASASPLPQGSASPLPDETEVPEEPTAPPPTPSTTEEPIAPPAVEEVITQPVELPQIGEPVPPMSLPIEMVNGIHYVTDPQFNKKITLFCMNNKRHWPHHTENMGDVQVPEYVEGYLTPEDFASPELYEQCMGQLAGLLYVGYPYNANGLYKIVDRNEQRLPTEAEFNRMLIPDHLLVEAYPYIAHHDFVYNDWVESNEKHMAPLRQFIQEVMNLGLHGGTTANGLEFADIVEFPFYKAAYCMTAETTETPLQNYADWYSTSYYVTEEQAYDATQEAVWYLLHEYGVEDNDIGTLANNALAGTLYRASRRVKILDHEPSVDEIHLEGDTNFHYEPKDGMWHSGKLKIVEPEEYDGIYYMEFPPGVSAICDNLNYVYGNEEYELVADHNPHPGESFRVTSRIPYMLALRQYSPANDIVVNGKKFQHMAGAVVEFKTLSMSYNYTPDIVGNLAITKEVIGENDLAKEFMFRVEICANGINGLYGDVEFNNGVGMFTLHAGDSVNIVNLPAGVVYRITEIGADGYDVSSEQAVGLVRANDTITVPFVNTVRPDLSIQKTVTGELGDLTASFRFDITLKDRNDVPISGTYRGIVMDQDGYEEARNVVFTAGKTEVSLRHGETLTIIDLPYASKYTIVENEEDRKTYLTSYKDDENQALTPDHVLDRDQTVRVINNKEYVPDTGVKDRSGMAGILLTILSLAALMLTCMHNRSDSLHER